MTYLFDTPEQRQKMLQAIGVNSVDELFEQIPAALQLDRELRLPPALSELELQHEMEIALGAAGSSPLCFMGGGAYDHFIPAVVDEITSRGEFYTAYTPYQPEASQGTLQAFFEYQSLICRLTGMDVSNASLYDGATSVSEAVFMAMRINGRHGNVVVAGSLNPQYQQVLQTYLCQLETNIITIPAVNGVISPADAAAAVNDQTCAVVMQQPNFLGCLEDVAAITEIAHRSGALSILAFDPISPGMLRKPSDYGVDIAVAEGQPLGTPLQFGGPWLGIFTCRSEYVRKMPGRLVGTTTDRNGKPCFVLNLQTREQHIRRDKATSNICTNQGLIALRTAVFLATVGRKGLQQMATLCHRKAQYAAARLTSIPGIELCFQQPFFREFAVRTPISAAIIIRQLAAEGFNVGPDLSVTGLNDIHQPENCFLVAVTEKRTRSEIDELATKLSALV